MLLLLLRNKYGLQFLSFSELSAQCSRKRCIKPPFMLSKQTVSTPGVPSEAFLEWAKQSVALRRHPMAELVKKLANRLPFLCT